MLGNGDTQLIKYYTLSGLLFKFICYFFKKLKFMCSYGREETRVYVLICTRRNACLCAHMYAKKHMFMFSYGLESRGALDEYLKMFTGQYTRFRCQLIIEQRRSGESNLLVSSLLAYTKYAQTKI